jgi:hypothetical protein
VDRNGWRVIESRHCPVRFRRPHGTQELPIPESGSRIDQLRSFLNIASDDDFRLVVGFLLSCYRERGPFPILAIHGEQGSCKTTTARVLRELIDPNAAPVRSEPREPRDMLIAANNGWVIALDNLSNLPTWLSESLCRLSTGGGFSTRTLYENDEETIFQVQRPALLTGIEEVTTRSDLLDRAIVLYLPRVEDDRRLTEEEFYNQFYEARPQLIGALLDGVSCALRRIENVTLGRIPRMADFAKWVTAAEPAFGWEEGSFMRAYAENRGAANELTLEASPVATAIQKISDFRGGATELLNSLNSAVDDRTRSLKSWPGTGRALSGTLRRLAPNLAVIGIKIDFDRPPRKTRGKRLITISGCASAPISPSPPSPD